MAEKLKPLRLEGMKIGFRNFAGEEGPYNKKGDRNFVVFLDPIFAEEIAERGWNVKWPKPNEDIDPENDERRPYLPVAVSKNGGWKIVTVMDEEATMVHEDELDMLDWIEYDFCDMVLNPYVWSVNGNTGVKAYLKSLYINVATDEFARKYGI